MAIFRYPGGKTKLAPAIAAEARDYAFFAEPFVGGGSVFSRVLTDTDCVVLINDLDPLMGAFWSIVFGDDDAFEGLAHMVESTPISMDTFNHMRAHEPQSALERAFAALFFNRTTFSGIRTSGPIGGYAQSGKYTVDCRFNSARVLGDMRRIREYRSRVHVYSEDFEVFLSRVPADGFVYADPPYYVKGDALYPEKMTDADHARLAQCLRERSFLLSYDVHPRILELYTPWAEVGDVQLLYTMTGSNRKNQKQTEYLIRNR